MRRYVTRARRRLHADERGVDTIAAIFVIPVIFVLIMGIVDVSMQVRSRMMVENILRDVARSAAADGGNMSRLNTGKPWDVRATEQLWDAAHGKCKVSGCKPGQRPTVDCNIITPLGSTAPIVSSQAAQAGDVITCRVYYPYKGVNEGLLNAPVMGLGLGGLIKPFTVQASARAEVGNVG